MPIISTIGRRSLRVRALLWSIYLLLIIGATTMVYPFLLMLSGSTKSSVDSPSAKVVPPFLASDTDLYRKYVEALFNEHQVVAENAYHIDIPSFRTLEAPDQTNAALVDTWTDFLQATELPAYAYTIGYVEAPVSRGVLPSHLRVFKKELLERFDNIEAMNDAMKTNFVSWNAFAWRREEFQQRRNKIIDLPFNRTFDEFKTRQPLEDRYYFSIEGFFRNQYLKSQYTSDIDAYNREHGTSYAGWDQVHLDRRLPTGPGRTEQERQDWLEFTRSLVSLLWLRADASAATDYRKFLLAKYGDVESINRKYGSNYRTLFAVPFPRACPIDGLPASDWETFLQGWPDPNTGTLHILPAERLSIHSVDFLFRDYLQERFGSLSQANQALGLQASAWIDVLPPQRDWHYLAFADKKGSLRWEFISRNFITVVDYMAVHGRGIYNTFVYCTLAVLVALIVNPVAAYALSRYKPPSAYKVLLFLMLTMAFPPMVTQIPVFLMLREFQLLNTFWALILPGVASGYAIFLLKGFFDSLPQELYESAQIDGAGEFRIFWQITMSLSKPILAVIALQAFTAAYSNFLMALLICQDEKMWTLMPWLYQLQQRSGEGVIFASLLVAAIPTFVIFVFAQNIIMRGIVVPVEK
ncbi:MAG: ABC transporter permease subunit [Candidatus Latescibacteria bacterium]|nr:ABC transporter permease subunit [Candidatus Latescibacterota bacterium]